jgi:hypothetical protein
MKSPSKKLTELAKKTISTHEKSLSAFIEGFALLLRSKAKESFKNRNLKIDGKTDVSIANVVEQVAKILRIEVQKIEIEAPFKRKKASPDE